MSNKSGKNWFQFGWHPSEEELLLLLDGEASERQANKMRRHLEGCWACRNRRDKFDRAILTFMDFCETGTVEPRSLPPRANAQFVERLRLAANTDQPPARFRQWIKASHLFVMQRQFIVSIIATLFIVSAIAILLLRNEHVVSAQEFLQRSTQAETLSLSRVGDPVVYRKVQIKRIGRNETITWESWNDAQRKQFRQRIADKQGLRFLQANEKSAPAILAELAQISHANHFDIQRPLSATVFAEWRQSIQAKAEIVTSVNSLLKLTTTNKHADSLNTITEAALLVRKSDWHPVILQLKVQGNNEIREYELSETAYEVLPLQALTVFTDVLPALPAPALSTAIKTATVEPTTAVIKPIPSPMSTMPSVAALQTAEVAVLYALHQAKADLGEQLEVVYDNGKQIIVRGLVQNTARKEELLNALTNIALVNLQIQTIDEAIKQTQRPTHSPPNHETVLATDENRTTAVSAPLMVPPFQQKLIESLGGKKSMTETDRAEINRKVTQFYNAVETDASTAMAEAWALRRLQERTLATVNNELDVISRQRLEEITRNHLARLRQRTHSLQMRLRPLLLALTDETAAVPQFPETTRTTKMQMVFRGVEQLRRLTDQLIAGQPTASVPQTARSVLIELARLDTLLTDLEKN